ncbi:MAG: hypothetical protein AB7U61_05790 [Methylocystis sp.]
MRRFLRYATGSRALVATLVILAAAAALSLLARLNSYRLLGDVAYGREAPPAPRLAGEADDAVRPRNTHALAAAIDAAGGEARAIYYSGVTYRGIIGAFSPLLHFLAPVADDVTAFVMAKRASALETKERRVGDRDEDVQ